MLLGAFSHVRTLVASNGKRIERPVIRKNPFYGDQTWCKSSFWSPATDSSDLSLYQSRPGNRLISPQWWWFSSKGNPWRKFHGIARLVKWANGIWPRFIWSHFEKDYRQLLMLKSCGKLFDKKFTNKNRSQLTDLSFWQVFDDSDSLFNDLTSLFADSWARPGVDLRPEMLPLGWEVEREKVGKFWGGDHFGIFLESTVLWYSVSTKGIKFQL